MIPFYRLLIVDDERPLREGLMAFDWAAVGFEAVGSAADGEAALAFLREHRVDVLLTDIKMPFVDGIELCRRAKVLHPAMKMILLSGHKDFEYARAAIGLGVTEYLLKPINLDELGHLFHILKADFDDQAAPPVPPPAENQPDSGLIPVVQAVLEGLPEVAFRRFRELLAPGPPSAPVPFEYLRLRVHHGLGRVASYVTSKLDAPEAPPPPREDTGAEARTPDDLWQVARLELARLTEVCQPAPKSLAWAYVQKALVYLHQNLGSKISMSQVAEQVGLTESYFSQIFKKETGVNFVDYVRDRRIAHAIELMKTTDLRIYQIGSAVGYDDSAYFAGTFRRCTGHTPLDYKRRLPGVMEGSG